MHSAAGETFSLVSQARQSSLEEALLLLGRAEAIAPAMDETLLLIADAYDVLGRESDYQRVLQRWSVLSRSSYTQAQPAPDDRLEITARVDPPEVAAAILDRRGVVLVRKLFRPSFLLDVRKNLVAAVEATGRDSHPAESAIVESFMPPYLAKIIDLILPGDWTLGTCWARYVTKTGGTPYHQDIKAFLAMGINAWTPLDPCGVDAPGLEVIPHRLFEMLPGMQVEGQWNKIRIADETVTEKCGAERLAPVMEVGDSIIFLGSTVHRTTSTEGMSKPRASMEVRFKRKFAA